MWELHASNLSVVRELKLFSVREHVNTLACWPPLSVGAHPSSPPALWAVLHNLGPSKLVEIDLLSGSVARTFSKARSDSTPTFARACALARSRTHACALALALPPTSGWRQVPRPVPVAQLQRRHAVQRRGAPGAG